MNALQERLGAAVEMDALDYDGAVFARDRYGAVRGRIARRRAARSAGIGGASVLGVGAVAFGAGQVPWSGFVLGATPAGSGSVVCTTSGPDAVAGSDEDAPDFAVAWATVGGASLWTFAGKDGDTLATAHLEGDVLRVTDFDGTSSDVEAGADGAYTFTVGGYQVSSTFADGQDTEVTITTISSGSRPEAPDIEVLAGAPDNAVFVVLDKESGASYFVGASYVDTNDPSTGTPLAWNVDGSEVQMTAVDAHIGTLTLPSGATVEVNTLTGGVTPSDPDAVLITPAKDYQGTEASPSPSVTCMTVTLEPTASASPSASPSPSVSASPSISATPTSEPAAALDSPFYCGFPISGKEYGSYDFGIFDITTVPADEINATLDRQVEIIGEEWWDRGTGDVLRVSLNTTDQPAHGGLSGAGSTIAGDPSEIVKAGYLDLSGQGAAFARGLSFVAVRDGVVVGTLPNSPQSDGHTYNDGDDPDPSTYFLTPDGAFTACPGVELGDDWDLYAVGGETFVYADGTTDPTHYTWKKVELP